VRVLRMVIAVALGLVAAALFVRDVLAFMVTHTPRTQGEPVRDGLGRPLGEAPALVRSMFGTERLWPGFWPTALDLGLAAVAFYVGYAAFLMWPWRKETR
jgi:hypothetical protein